MLLIKSMKILFLKFKVSKSLLSRDGTRKWLFELEDGKEIETVYIPEKIGAQSVCPHK